MMSGSAGAGCMPAVGTAHPTDPHSSIAGCRRSQPAPSWAHCQPPLLDGHALGHSSGKPTVQQCLSDLGPIDQPPVFAGFP